MGLSVIIQQEICDMTFDVYFLAEFFIIFLFDFFHLIFMAFICLRVIVLICRFLQNLSPAHNSHVNAPIISQLASSRKNSGLFHGLLHLVAGSPYDSSARYFCIGDSPIVLALNIRLIRRRILQGPLRLR